MDDLASALLEAAPAVDLDDGLSTFRARRRVRRRRRRIARVSVAVLIPALLLIALAAQARDRPVSLSTTAPPGATRSTLLEGRDFTVLSVSKDSDDLGRLRSATSADQLEHLWSALHLGPDRPLFDGPVVSLTVAGTSCEPTLTQFTWDGDLLTPELTSRSDACFLKLTAWTLVVRLVDTPALHPSFTLRLPADQDAYREQRLAVTLPTTLAREDPGQILPKGVADEHGNDVGEIRQSELDAARAATIARMERDGVTDSARDLTDDQRRAYQVLFPAPVRDEHGTITGYLAGHYYTLDAYAKARTAAERLLDR